MVRVWMAIRRTVLAIMVALGSATSWAEITVVGSSRPEQPVPASADANAWSDSSLQLLQPTMLDEIPSSTPGLSPQPEPQAAPPVTVYEKPWLTWTQHPVETVCYAGFDYSNWEEPKGGFSSPANEFGALFTVGIQRTSGPARLRFELFEGDMNFNGSVYPYDFPMNSQSKILGFRTEFELLRDANCFGWQDVVAYAGIGTRFWIRDIQAGFAPLMGGWLTGCQETWWTLYPYMGLEKTWHIDTGGDVFASGRLGCTSFTYECNSEFGPQSFFPAPGLTGQVECGFRYEGLLCSVYFEGMGWGPSATVHTMSERSATMFETGLKLGIVY
jgi:hypothetical protein